MQKQHAVAIQTLLEDTQSRLQRVEAEYRDQHITGAHMIERLEDTVRELTETNKNLEAQRNELQHSYTTMEVKCADSEVQLDAIRSKFSELQDNHYSAMKRYEEQLNELQTKSAETEDLLRQELDKMADRNDNEKRAAESMIDDLKKSLSELQLERNRTVQELESQRIFDIKSLQNEFELKMAELANEMDTERANAEKKITKLEIEIGERDSELVAVVDRCRTEAARNEQQIEEFRRHVEETTLKALADSRAQFAELEKELSQISRELKTVTKERDEFRDAYDVLKREHEQQVEDLVRAHAAELAIIRESGVHERDSAVNELKAECERKTAELANKLKQVEQEMVANENEWKTRTSRLIDQAAAEARQELINHFDEQRMEMIRNHDAEMSASLEQWDQERNRLNSQLEERINNESNVSSCYYVLGFFNRKQNLRYGRRKTQKLRQFVEN